jgi:hypothetical protein
MPQLRLAFLILAHGDAPQLVRLCRALQPHSVFVHIDAKATAFPFDTIAALPNVTQAKPSVAVHWGDFSVVEATLNLIKAARDKGRFDRFVLLSGSCYLAKPIAALEALFMQNPRREWITLTQINRGSHLYNMIGRRWRMSPLVGHRGVDTKLRIGWNKISKLLGRDLEREIQMKPYFGSQWWALTEDCIAMVLAFVKSHPSFVHAYKSVYAPDEHFFHTIIGNSSFGQTADRVEDCGLATNKLTPLHLIATTEERYFGTEESDFSRISTTEQFFIRKLSTSRSAALLDRIDQELLQTSPLGKVQ